MFKKNTVQNRIPVGMDFLVGYSVQSWSLIDSSQIYETIFKGSESKIIYGPNYGTRFFFFCSTSKMST